VTPDGKFTEREVGAALQELQEVRHDHRNLRMIVTLLTEQHEKIRVDQAKLHTKLTTVTSVVVGLFAIIGWVLNYLRAS
tara:strand:- start:2734 stop:2970 length:237 start_codon:yes stop_codon:yes gene_type:complete